MKKKKLRSIPSLKKKAWKLRSAYVRIRDNFTCITCGSVLTFKTSSGGHYIHGDKYDHIEENINCQCTRCNFRRHGNLGRYTLALNKKYGPGTAEKLLAFEDKLEGQKYNISREELVVIIADLTTKLQGMENTEWKK